MQRTPEYRLFIAAACLIAGAAHAGTTWGRILNPTGEAPLGAFKAVYINTQSPRDIVASETVRDIAINYAWADFHGIKSEDFGAYWVGRIDVRKDEERVLELSQSWAKSRVFIDGQLVFEGGQSVRKPVRLTKGRHLVEVEYINNWHTTEFKVALNPVVELLNSVHAGERLRSLGIQNPEVHYVGVYESSARDLTIKLPVAPSKRPIVLVLSSYSPVSWVINEASPGNVRAVIQGSAHPGGEVRGVNTRKVAVLPVAGRIGSYEVNARCSCIASNYHCESNGHLLETKATIERITGAPLASFSGAYSKDVIAVPGMVIDAQAEESNRIVAERQRVERENCERQGNPDFDRIFEESPDEG